MNTLTLTYICGTVIIISVLVLLFANYWVSKYFNYLKICENKKRLKENMFYKELSSKIDNLIYIQNETIEIFRKGKE